MRFAVFSSLLALAGAAAGLDVDARAVKFGRRAAAGDAQVERREAIKATFLRNFKAYEDFASPKDQLNPVSKQGSNDGVLAGWGGTIVDAMSTMLVMGLEKDAIFQRALNHTKHINFTVTSEGDPRGSVSVFELTIRYIGGMLSTYQLAGEKKEHRFLVDQAKTLADALSNAWFQGNRLPFNHFNLNLSAPVDTKNDGVSVAEAGTLLIEWGMLSHYTGNQTYERLARDAMNAIVDTPTPVLPGLPPNSLGARNESATEKVPYLTWGGGADSYWEYLLKYGQLTGEDVKGKYPSAFATAVDNSVKNLFIKTGVGNLTFISDYTNGSPVYVTSHLASFIGGTWALGGQLYKRDDWVQHGLELSESAWRVGNGSDTGLVAEAWGYFDTNGEAKGWRDGVSHGRIEFNNEHGFFTTVASYVLRPEVIESIFYAWRITGDTLWRDMAWYSFQAMTKYLLTPSGGYAGIGNVNDISSGLIDSNPSFFSAELMKYLYLIFDDSSNYSLDDYVFSTEAHPFKVLKRNPAYGKVQGTKHHYKPLPPLSAARDKPVSMDAAPTPTKTTKAGQSAANAQSADGQGAAANDAHSAHHEGAYSQTASYADGVEVAARVVVQLVGSVSYGAAKAMFSGYPQL